MDEANLEMEEQLARARDVAVDHQDLYPATKQDVEVYIRTYTTMLRSSGEVEVKALVQAHLNANSALHINARGAAPDMSAFLYCIQRSARRHNAGAPCFARAIEEVFRKQGYQVENVDPCQLARQAQTLVVGRQGNACCVRHFSQRRR